MESYLEHSGVLHRSGRYKEGTGEDPYQCHSSFYSYANQLKKNGLSEKEIATACGLTVKEYRAKYSNARNEKYGQDVAMARRLKEKGYSNVAIAERMGTTESSVRNWLKPGAETKANKTTQTSNVLKDAVKKSKYIDITGGVENQMGITKNTLDNAVQMLVDQGYTVHYLRVPQMGTNEKTSIKVLAKPGTTWKEVNANQADISFPGYKSNDRGSSYEGLKNPVSVSSKRVKINYREDGGIDKDGVIELRRGVDDISLGKARYAQVRIAVDGTHYLKGMAMYSDNMPDGVDIVFNTNKKKGTPMLGEKDNSVLKPMKKGTDNPFGATIKGEDRLKMAQRFYIDKDGKKRQSAINIVNEEGDWDVWRKSLSSQMLSKQSPILAKKQLKLAYDLKKEEFNEIMSLKNPVIKQHLLDKFADECESAAVHLKAAGLPRQASKAILPFPSMKENEIYAPSFRNGERVALVRYPHAGTFEIPELVVNNKHKEANSLIKNAKDAVGIHPKVAERLSGADFDGDTVLVIPTKGVKLKTSKALDGLKDFDPKVSYPAYPGMTRTGEKGSGFHKQQQMGSVSNLITDMTIKGADRTELAAAVRHSMVVIDAEKHNLNYKQSAIDNNIAALKTKYQGSANAGASTLISKASGDYRRPVTKEITSTKNMTPSELKRYKAGEKIFRETGETYTNKKGKTVQRLEKTTKMGAVSNAYDLSSGSLIESVYADHANSLKALAKQSRKVSRSTQAIPYSPEAKKKYANEVSSLNHKLNEALKNRPLERKAQLLANAEVNVVKAANPDMDKDDLKKLKSRALTSARAKTGAGKQQIKIEANEWEAIQAGAITTNKLKQIINNADLDTLKQLAMPRESKLMSAGKVQKAKAMQANGYTLSEIADSLGVSVSTLNKALE